MKTYPEMNKQIIRMLRLDASHNPAAKIYAAQRIEELERQLAYCNAECKAAMKHIVKLERWLADTRLSIHVHEKSLDEYAQTAYRLRKELETERELRQDAEKALAIATSTLEWYAVAHPGRSDDALMKIEDLLSPEAMWRVIEIEQKK